MSNTDIVREISDIHESFVENLQYFLSSVPETGLNIKKLLNLIPENCIITKSDKNVGISILPPEWYAKEYKNQILKGGHELIEMTETQCIANLLNKIRIFKEGYCSEQRKVLNKMWPRNVAKPRIGVLKLAPKVG